MMSPGRSTFDLRIVTIDGQPRHWVVRESRSPTTNLHLGNRRGDLAAVRERLGDEAIAAIERTCTHVAAIFPGSLRLGLDVLISPGFRSHVVLEINAFGDLLPGVLWNGQDTYTAQVAAWLQKHGSRMSEL